GYWLAGGRISFDHEALHASASLHEQRDAGGIGRRNLGLDAHSDLGEVAGVGALMLLELDSTSIANLRVWTDLALLASVDVTVEYLKPEPALLLSRQSVLSVFGTEGYHEAGGTGR